MKTFYILTRYPPFLSRYPPIKLLHYSQSGEALCLVPHWRHLRSNARHQLTVPSDLTSSQHLRSAGICCRWSDDVQHFARWSTRSCSQHIDFRTQLSDSCWRLIFSLPISTFSALGMSHVMCSINVRYLLTYFTWLKWISFCFEFVLFAFASNAISFWQAKIATTIRSYTKYVMDGINAAETALCHCQVICYMPSAVQCLNCLHIFTWN